MPETPSYQRFFAELKRRRVFRVMAVYGAAGFILLQVVELLIPALLLPDWTYRLITLLLIIGFPIAIILAWAFESTPDGMKRTDSASEAELAAIASAPPAKRWPAGIMALAATGLFAGAVYTGLRASGDGVSANESARTPGAETASPVAPASLTTDAEVSRQAVAVLPFADLTGTDESRAFALGLHDDLMTQLTQVPDLKVTSRTSVMAYADQSRPVAEIARELSVGSIVEGGVRTSGGNVRINVQLVDPATDEHLWAHTYDGELTAETVFQIQGEIARAVATALEAELSEETGAALGTVLTENIEAWNAFHEGKLLEERAQEPESERATVAAYQQAVDLDPGFVAAWARLVRAQAWLLRRGLESDTMPARRSLDALQELDPGGSDALYAEGVYHYYARGDYESALAALQAARRVRPGDPEIMQHAGWVLRRLGRWDEAMELIDRAIQLDPRNPTLLWNQGLNNYRLRRFGTGSRQFEMALELDPGGPIVGAFFTEVKLFSEGDSAAARQTLEAGRGLDAEGQKEALAYWLAYMARDYDRAIQIDPRNATLVWNQGLNNYRLRRFGTGSRQFTMAVDLDPSGPIVGAFFAELKLFSEGDSAAARRALEAGRGLNAEGQREALSYWLAYVGRDYDRAIEHALDLTGEPAGVATSSTVLHDHSRAMRLSLAYRLAGDDQTARTWADSAVAEARAALAERPEPVPWDRFGAAASAHAFLGMSLALRGEPGDAGEAVRHAEEAVRLYGYERDAADGDTFDWLLVRTYVLVDQPDDAIEQMDLMLSYPSVFGLGDLKLDPLYD
ncbi:MAG: tetratricopeptide repeat protein, partial [Gemmatimonadetes bacterium]|nr:tetratricopeptide repeat protein [Gemmatimonadota bacterium]